MEQDKIKKRHWLAPYYSALACVMTVYSTTLIMLGNHVPMLVAGLAIAAAIVGYLVCRVVQLRGRITLAMAVIGFPFLMAMIFATAWKLAPFAERQATYDRLRAAGIRCHIRDGDRSTLVHTCGFKHRPWRPRRSGRFPTCLPG
jgi:hypothetical protein